MGGRIALEEEFSKVLTTLEELLTRSLSTLIQELASSELGGAFGGGAFVA